jgi:hypothetical protein
MKTQPPSDLKDNKPRNSELESTQIWLIFIYGICEQHI